MVQENKSRVPSECAKITDEMKTKPKRTYQKKLSLHPMKFEDAVSALLKVKPEPKPVKKKSKPTNGE
jgi:hypothetical protein